MEYGPDIYYDLKTPVPPPDIALAHPPHPPQADTVLGRRDNAGKLRYDLLPPDAIQELVKIYTFGAEKYGARNWEKGLSFQDTIAAIDRHLAAFRLGAERDEETGRLHAAHAAWGCLALVAFLLRGTGVDDRQDLPRPAE